MKTNRRNFLKKSTLTLFGFTLIGKVSTAKPFIVADCFATTKDYFGIGPYYTANAPNISNNILASSTEVGTRLILSGYVKNLECNAFLPNTLIDIWHANDDGQYDNSGFNLRGKVYSDSNGYYSFETILPGKYLNGNDFRPSHIHFKITPPNSNAFITHLYFAGDTSIAIDPVASITTGEFIA